MKRRMKSKVLLLTTIMALALFTGCGQAAEQTANTQSDAAPETTKETQTETPVETQPETANATDEAAVESNTEKGDDTHITFYLVRHGQTFSNIKEATIGRGGNAELTPTGKKYAYSLGMGLKDEGIEFSAVYSSTLARAHQTAEFILAGMGETSYEVKENPDLRDISWGAVEGGRQADLEPLYGADGNDFEFYFGNYNDEDFVSPVDGVETTREFADRFEGALKEIVAEHEGETANILITAHSTIGFYLSQFTDGVPTGTPNTSASILEYKDGSFNMVEFGGVKELEAGIEKYETMEPLEIILVISPQTIFQEAAVLEGTSDSELSEEGIKSAEALKEKLDLSSITAIYSSELNRSRQTRSIFLDNADQDVIENSMLDEMFLGYWEAEKIALLQETDSENYNLLMSGNQILDFPVVDGDSEKPSIAAYRLESALRMIGDEHLSSEGKVVVFTHPLILKAFLNDQFPDTQIEATDKMQMVTLTFKEDVFTLEDTTEIE